MFIVKVLPAPIVRLYTAALVLITGLFVPEVMTAVVYLVGTPLVQFDAVFQALVVPIHVVVAFVGSAIVIELEVKLLDVQPPRSGVTRQVTTSLFDKEVLVYVLLFVPTFTPFNRH